MDAATVNALVQGLGPLGAVIALAAYAMWQKPRAEPLARPVSPEYERGMVAAMANAATALSAIAKSLDQIERHIEVMNARRN